jgi:phosphatidylglycerol:prolipoprotein diacylglycerol transferase
LTIEGLGESLRTTLFYIPHRFDWDPTGLPLFGFGWLLILWLLFGGLLMAWTVRTKGWGKETTGLLPVLIIVAVVIRFVLPLLETEHPYYPDQDPLGLPIRGYGLLVLFGIVAGVGLAAYRASRMGVDPESIFSLGFWLFVFGIVGARLTFVIENWDEQFAKESLTKTMQAVASVTEGGLVVYGALIGATVGFLVFVIRRRLPMLAMADLIAPSLLVGLSLGRIGCLLNGCCWGGVCDNQNSFQELSMTFPSADPPSTRYILRPSDSPPYMDHRSRGLLQGVQFAGSKEGSTPTGKPVIAAVDDSLVHNIETRSSRPLVVGDRISRVNGIEVQSVEDAFGALTANTEKSPTQVRIETVDGRSYRWELPERSLPVFPTQVFSAINAALTALFLWCFYPFRRRDGEVIALTLTIYPVSRFLLEQIRVDVPPIEYFGISLSTSQWISVLMLVAVGVFWVFLLRRPKCSALPPNVEPAS